jgi:predicted GIY-YIG superfamily endonuclease
MATVYLLHFAAPIAPGRHTCQHYLGVADDLERRIAEHRAGRGSRLCEVAKERNISFEVVRVWEGSRKLERRLKNQKNSPKLCPICRAQRK